MKYHVAIINHIYNIYQMTVVILYGLKLDYKTVYYSIFYREKESGMCIP